MENKRITSEESQFIYGTVNKSEGLKDMKRKLVALISIMLLCCSICACGEDSSSSYDTREERDESSIQNVSEGSDVEAESSVTINENNKDVEPLGQMSERPDEQNGSEGIVQPGGYRYNEDGVVMFTQEEFAQYIEVVEINLDNWSEYFCDYEYEEREYGLYYNIGFGLKPEYIGRVDAVKLKFNGKIRYWENGSIDAIHNGADGVVQHYIGGEIVEFEDITSSYTPNFEVYPYTYPYCSLSHYTQFECLEADGQLYLFNIPNDVEEYVVEGWEEKYFNFKNAPYTNDIPKCRQAREAYETYR